MRSGGAALCCWPRHSELSSPAGPDPPPPAAPPGPAAPPDEGPSRSSSPDVVRDVVCRRSWRSHTDLPALHAEEASGAREEEPRAEISNDRSKPVKETINEELRARRVFSFRLHEWTDDERGGAERGGAERSGAGRGGARIHDCISELSAMSVEPADYADAACYLRESPAEVSEVARVAGGARCRVSSDGDILAPHARPESGAFSESDVEWWSSPPVRRVVPSSAATAATSSADTAATTATAIETAI